jgi:diadenosine tetraphosphate (Ap4A) HIT family hydrolase
MNRCPFCEFDRARLVAESEVAIALRDAFRISEGHTLVLPRRHVTSIYDLSSEDQAAVWTLVGQVRGTLLHQFAADGINIGVNDGRAAGQTAEHAHIHVIPRRKGDVPDPRGGVRNIIRSKARYWEE